MNKTTFEMVCNGKTKLTSLKRLLKTMLTQNFRGTTKSIMVYLKGQVTVPEVFAAQFPIVWRMARKELLFLLELALPHHDLRLKTIVIIGNIPSRHKKRQFYALPA